MRFCFALAAVVIWIVSFLSVQCCAQDAFWTGTGDGTSWNDGGNWDTGTVPGIDQFAFFGGLFAPPSGSALEVQVNQATQASDFIAFETLNLELNADFTAGGLTVFAGGGSLNIKNHTYTGPLGFGETEGDFGPLESPFSLARAGGVLNLTGIYLVGDSEVSPTVFDLPDTDSVISEGSGSILENSVFNINGASVNWDGEIDGGTVNLNSGTISGGTAVNSGGTLNVNGGTLSGDLSLGNLVGVAPTINRSGGTLDLGSLAMLNGGQLTIGETDNITESINIAESSELTVNRSLNLTGNLRVAGDSKVLLNGNLVAQQLIYDGDSFARASGVSVDVDLLEFKNAEYTYDGTDVFARAIRIDNGRLNIDQAASSSNGFVNASANSTVNVNAETSVGSGGFGIAGGSTLNLNASTNARVTAAGLSVVNINADVDSGSGLRVFGSTLNLNEGTLRGGLELSEENGISSTFNRSNQGSLVLSSLEIQGETHLDFVDGDSFTPGSGRIHLSDGASVDFLNSSLVTAGDILNLSSNSRVRVVQSAGQMDGLALSNSSQLGIDETSSLELIFDEGLALEGELDYALRLNFDHTDLLQGYLDSGLISISGAGTADIGVIRDLAQFGDFTYVGYIGNATSVPEPSSSLVLMLSLALFTRRDRRVGV